MIYMCMMSIKTISLSILFLPLYVTLYGRISVEDSLSLMLTRTIAGQHTQTYVDEFDNIYALTKNNQLKKIPAGNDSGLVFNDIRKYGQVHSFDAVNPLRITVFYKDFFTVLFLDRFLSPRSTVDLRKCGIYAPLAIAQSYDNNLWVYDDADNQLKKISAEGKVLFTTPDLRIAFPTGIKPQWLFDTNGSLYLCDSLRGIFVFDYYGAFKSKTDITHWQSIFIQGEILAFAKNNSYTLYDMANKKKWSMTLPFNNHVIAVGNKLVCLDSNNLKLFSVKKM